MSVIKEIEPDVSERFARTQPQNWCCAARVTEQIQCPEKKTFQRYRIKEMEKKSLRPLKLYHLYLTGVIGMEVIIASPLFLGKMFTLLDCSTKKAHILQCIGKQLNLQLWDTAKAGYFFPILIFNFGLIQS